MSRHARLFVLLALLTSVGQAFIAQAATPAAPSNLAASATSETSVVLTWTDNSTNENQFRIERSTSATTGFVQIAKTKANAKTYTNTGLAAATGYYYRVYAFRKSNPPSPYSNTAFVTTLGRDSAAPSVPSGLSANPTNCSRIDLTWTPSSDSGSGVAGYEVSRGGSVIAHTTTASFSDASLPPSSGFSYNVAAFDNAGNYSSMSPAVNASTPSCTTNQPPSANAGPDRSTMSLSSIVLDGSGSADPDGTVVSWSWSFGDGATGSGANVNHLWSSPGSYNVTLTVTDNSGASASDSATVVVANRAPSANAGADQSGTTGSSLSFNGSGSNDMDGTIVSYSWSFGDGGTASGMNVSHVFSTSGNFTVTLTTTDNLGAQGTDAAAANVTASVTIPNPPSALSATAASSSRIDLTWSDNSSNETGFKIERASSSTGPFSQIGTSTAASFSDTSAPVASTSFYRVTAYNTAGTSAPSNVASATTSDNVPASPSGLGATAASSSRINLAWTDNSSNETGFKIERASSSTGPFTQIGTSTAASFSDMSAPVASTSFYRVSAYNTAGTSVPSNIASATTPDVPPAAPSGLAATAVSSTRVNLAWTDNSNNESGFRIERASASTGPFTQIGTSTLASFSDMSAPVASTSFYRVTAYNTAGTSAPSNVDSATTPDVPPAAPSGLGATAVSSSRIDLSWTDNSNNESGFRIERASSSTGPFTQIGTSTAASFTDSSAPVASTSFYRVIAYNTAGSSAPSNVDSATTPDVPPASPASASAVGASQSQINLSWADSSSNETSFKIERASAASGPWSQVATTGANTTSWSNTGLAASTTWYYRVKASNAAGDSAPSPTASATTQASAPVLPAAPSSLSATATSSSAISLSWTDNSTNETGFKVERGTASAGPFTQIGTPGAGATSYADSGLSAGTTYYYRVRATTGVADSNYSNTASATTQSGSSDLTAPSVPSGVAATSPTCGGILINWGASTDNAGGSGMRGYKIYRKSTYVTEISASTRTFMDTALPSATYYYYYISAVDNAGNESAKSPATGTYTLSCMGTGGDYEWAKNAGGDIYPDDGFAVTADNAGNTYVTGDFSATTAFGTFSLVSAGTRDVFVAKYRADGTVAWAKRFGGPYDDFGSGIGVDAVGNVYVTGAFQGSIDLGSGYASAGGYDIFLAKFASADGRLLWSKRIGGSGSDEGLGLAMDSHGDLFITGQFFGTMDFGGGAVTNGSSYPQAFLAKYSGADGGHLWSKRFGKLTSYAPTTSGAGKGVAVDSSDNAVFTGSFNGPADFGTGALTNGGGSDVIVGKYSGTDGRALWTKGFGDSANQNGSSIAVDSTGAVVVTGDFISTINFGGASLPSSSTTQTIFLVKLGSDGSHVWSKSFVAAGLNVGSYGFGVAVDGSNSIVLTGQMSGPVDLGSGPMNNVGGVFASKYDSGGNFVWAKNYRGGGGQGRGVAIGLGDEIMITGNFDTVQDFGGGDLRSGANTGTDSFILCLEP